MDFSRRDGPLLQFSQTGKRNSQAQKLKDRGEHRIEMGTPHSKTPTLPAWHAQEARSQNSHIQVFKGCSPSLLAQAQACWIHLIAWASFLLGDYYSSQRSRVSIRDPCVFRHLHTLFLPVLNSSYLVPIRWTIVFWVFLVHLGPGMRVKRCQNWNSCIISLTLRCPFL